MLLHHSPEEPLARLVGGRPLHPAVGLRTDRPLFARLHAQATEVSAAEVAARCETAGVAVVVAGDDDYPEMFSCDQEAPPVIYVRGDPAVLTARRVGIVGTRNATAAGRATAHELGAALAENDVCVVSGLARGIDGAAHRGVRAGGGLAVGVVANGLDWPYPKQNSDLWAWVGEHGLLVSEWPPGTPPEAWRFPYRNRVIAALSEILVVVESRVTGGSLITAKAALDRDVDVMAVPGSVRNKAAEGTNKLLLEGAAPITCVDDVLVALALDHRRVPAACTGAECSMSAPASPTPTYWRCVRNGHARSTCWRSRSSVLRATLRCLSPNSSGSDWCSTAAAGSRQRAHDLLTVREGPSVG